MSGCVGCVNKIFGFGCEFDYLPFYQIQSMSGPNMFIIHFNFCIVVKQKGKKVK